MQKRAYDRFLMWKRMHYWLNTSDFKRAYMNVSRDKDEKALAVLDRLVESGDLASLRSWTTKYTQTSQLSYRQLRERAKLENVYNYSRLTKDQLIKALEVKHGQ
jgi:hypothetical protein